MPIDTCFHAWRRPTRRQLVISDEEFLDQIRHDKISLHFQRCKREFRLNNLHLNLSPSLLAKSLPLHEAQDCCNKFTAIYDASKVMWAKHICPWLWKRWLDPYKSNYEFGRFFAKLITLQADPSLLEFAEVIVLHKALCEQILECQKVITQDFDIYDVSVTGSQKAVIDLNKEQADCYIWQPLFRAILIVVTNNNLNLASPFDGEVHLVLTGMNDGLSEPITFCSISKEVYGYEGPQTQHVTTTLDIAMKFITDLENREARVFGVHPDPKLLEDIWRDPDDPQSPSFMERARNEYEWSGKEIEGPTSSWPVLDEWPSESKRHWPCPVQDIDHLPKSDQPWVQQKLQLRTYSDRPQRSQIFGPENLSHTTPHDARELRRE